MSQTGQLMPRDEAGIIALGAATQFSPDGIVSRTVVAGGPLRVTLFGFAAGQELTEHATPSRAIIQILSGSSQWTIAGKTREVRAGEILHLPPGTPHAVLAIEPFSMLLTLVREGAA